MDRPCFLVVDQEFPGSISTRKLVIETGKFNVITAYDSDEAISCLKRFPKVDGVVLNAEMADYEKCRKLISELRSIVPRLDVVVVSAGGFIRGDHTAYYVDSLNPKELLDCLQTLRKDATAEIIARESKSAG
jgi:NAD(P)-dependent dehydrogenase (short-subunit alcohol dehydrogenase family)